MKISKTYKIHESTRDAIQNLSATEDLSQGDVIDRAILLLKLQTTLHRPRYLISHQDYKNIHYLLYNLTEFVCGAYF